MLKPYDQIIKLLRDSEVSYKELNHEPVFTSEQASSIRGISADAGAKSLLIKAEDKFILAVLPGSARLDSSKLRKILGVKNMRFAKEDEVLEMMGCTIGACYPFGQIFNVDMLVDHKLSQNEHIFFNPALHTKSIKISWEDYKKITNPQIVDISKD